jgi:hypothetical protein
MIVFPIDCPSQFQGMSERLNGCKLEGTLEDLGLCMKWSCHQAAGHSPSIPSPANLSINGQTYASTICGRAHNLHFNCVKDINTAETGKKADLSNVKSHEPRLRQTHRAHWAIGRQGDSGVRPEDRRNKQLNTQNYHFHSETPFPFAVTRSNKPHTLFGLHFLKQFQAFPLVKTHYFV